MKKALSLLLSVAVMLSCTSVFAADTTEGAAVTYTGKTANASSASDGHTYIVDDFSGLHGHINNADSMEYSISGILAADEAIENSVYRIYNAVLDGGWNMEGTAYAPVNVITETPKNGYYAQNPKPEKGYLWVYNRDTDKVINGWNYRDKSSALMYYGTEAGTAYLTPSTQVNTSSTDGTTYTSTISPKYLDFDIETKENSDKAVVISYDARITGKATVSGMIAEIADDGNGGYKADTWSEMFKMPTFTYTGTETQIQPYRVKPTDGYANKNNNHDQGTAIDPENMLIYKANDVGAMGSRLNSTTYGGYQEGDWVNITSVLTYNYDKRMYNVDYYLNGYKLGYSMYFCNYDKTKISEYKRTNSIANWAPNGGIKTVGWPLETMGYNRLGIMPVISLTADAGATASIDNFQMKVYEQTELSAFSTMSANSTSAKLSFSASKSDGTPISETSTLANAGLIDMSTANTNMVKVYKHNKNVTNPVES